MPVESFSSRQKCGGGVGVENKPPQTSSGVKNGEGYEGISLSSQLGSLNEHRELPSGVRDIAPAQNKPGVFLASPD